MNTQQLTYEQFKADILQWKNAHREEYGRFARLMADGDEAQYLAICGAVFMQLRGIQREWELTWNDDGIENFENIFLRFNESSVPGQIVDMYNEQREAKEPAPAKAPTSAWGRLKSIFSLRPKAEQITLSAPLVLSWLYYGKSFEALVSMLQKQSDRPEADEMDRQRCALVTKQIINVSIIKGFRTREDWDRHFAMDKAIRSGNIAEWALQSVVSDMGVDDTNDNFKANERSDSDNVSVTPRTAGKKKIQERPLADYLNCANKVAVIQCIRDFVSVNTSAVHQALPYYVLKDLSIVMGMHAAKEYSLAITAQFTDLPSLKGESAIRQAIGLLKDERHVIKDGKDQLAPLIESDENSELFRSLTDAIKDIIEPVTDAE